MSLGRLVIASLLVFVALVVWAAPVSAHSFLVDTRPGQGQRLDRSPAEVVLQFTEAIAPGSAQIELTDGEGRSVPIGGVELEAENRVQRTWLVEPVEGVVAVSWQVTSTVDGHVSAGEFAFAVGETGPLPAATGSVSTGPGETAARWVLVGGLSLGAGSLIAAATGQIARTRGIRLGRAGLAVAALGPAIVYLQGMSGGPSWAVIGAGAAGFVLASAALAVRLAPTAARILTGAGILAWASRSHPATAAGVLGTLADAAHLAGAALWFGTLVLLVVDLWRTRRGDSTVMETARHYARWALGAVIVLAAAGALSAFSVLTAVSDLWTTGYGLLLLTKAGLFAMAISLAVVSRWRVLRGGKLYLLRRLTTMEVVVVAGVVAASGILAGMLPPALAQSEETLLGPPPIEGPVARAAGLAGNMTVGARAGGGRLDLLVYNSSTGGIDDVMIEATAILPNGTEVELKPRPCGAGCFTQQLAIPEGTTALAVAAASTEWADGTVELDIAWPPAPNQPELLDEMIAAMRNVDRLTLVETVSSGPGAQATNTSTLSGEAFIDLEVYANSDLDQVAPLPDGDGLRIYLPGSRILIDVHLDAQQRITDERIVSPGHEITRTFTYP